MTLSTCTVTDFPAGPHSITAEYLGNNILLPSTSAPITYTPSCTNSVTVTNANDLQLDANGIPILDSNGNTIVVPGSLREATLTPGLCYGATIDFAGDYDISIYKSQPYSLPLTTSGSVKIDATGHTIRLTGDGGLIFNTGDLEVKHLVLENSQWGINSWGGSVTVSDSVFQNMQCQNGGCAIVSTFAPVTVTNSSFTNIHSTSTNPSAWGGGAINTSGPLTVMGSTFSGNSALKGGAIYANRTLSVTNSTFSGNYTTEQSYYAEGGAILFDGTNLDSLTLINNTFVGNYTSVTAEYADGGGVKGSSPQSNIQNNVFANSTNGGNCSWNFTGSGYVLSNNLSDDNTCGSTGFTQSTALNLGPLGDNGGPTRTIPLLAGSAAIDAGDDSVCPATDQRGVTRPKGAHCDIGAYELEAAPAVDTTPPVVDSFSATSPTNTLSIPITAFTAHDDTGVTGYLVTQSSTPPASGDPGWITPAPTSYPVSATGTYTLYPWAMDAANNVSAVYSSPANVLVCFPNITVTNNNDLGPGSLRQAIVDVCQGGTITFNNTYTIHLQSSLSLSKGVTIDGTGYSVTLSGDADGDGTGDVQIFDIVNGTVNINALNLEKGYALNGAAIFIHSEGILNVTNATFSNNTVGNNGGAIENGGSLTIADSTFSYNTAGNLGGAINYEGTSLTVTSSTFSHNQTVNSGGAIFGYGFSVTNSTFVRNSAKTGSAIRTGNLTVTNSTFVDNPSDDYGDGTFGGTIYVTSSRTINNSIFKGFGTCSNPSNRTITTSGGHNMATDETCGDGFTYIGTTWQGPLGNNGGPTQTVPLMPGSPAIDSGDDAICAAAPVNNIDQRGISRPQGLHCDIGAFEAQIQAATVNLSDLTQIYDGSSKPVTVTTDPAGLSVDVTYNSSSTIPTDAGSYAVVATVNDPDYQGAASGTLIISPKTLVASIVAENKVYDGTFAAEFTCSLAGVFEGDDVACTGGTANFNRNYTGLWMVTATGLGLSGADAGNYTVNGTAYSNAQITQRPIAGSFTVSNKVYDGGTAATILTRSLSGVLPGDTVNMTGGVADFVSPDVDDGIQVNGSGFSLQCQYVTCDYYLDSISATTADITPATLVASIVAENKVYDGTFAAEFTCSLAGVFEGDDVTCTGGTANFNRNYTGSWLVTATGLGLSGADAGNYTVNSTAYGSASITKRPITIRADNMTKSYGSAITFLGSEFTISEGSLAVGDVITSVSLNSAGAPANATVAGSPYSIVPSSAVFSSSWAANDYQITYENGTLVVNPAATSTILTVSTNTSILHQPVTFSAIIAPATGTFSGTVIFYDGTTLLATMELGNGQAQFTTNDLAPGSHSITAVYSGNAGWEGSTSNAVGVKVAYQFVGFSQPVDGNGVLNIAKAGQTLPLKFRLLDYNGNPVTNLTSLTANVTNLSCSAGTTTDTIEEYATGMSGLQNLGDGYYQWNWKTPTSYVNSCKTLKLSVGDGSEYTALFQFKK